MLKNQLKLNSKKIYQLTRDHSLVQEKLNYGIYDRNQAALDPQKNVLVRTVGFEEEIEIDSHGNEKIVQKKIKNIVNNAT